MFAGTGGDKKWTLGAAPSPRRRASGGTAGLGRTAEGSSLSSYRFARGPCSAPRSRRPRLERGTPWQLRSDADEGCRRDYCCCDCRLPEES